MGTGLGGKHHDTRCDPLFFLAAIEALSIDAIELAHAAGKIRLGGLNYQMKVVVH